MRIAVCDDMSLDRKNLSEYILQYSDIFLLDIQIEEFGSGEDLLSVFSVSAFNIVFLDIYLDGISGIETAFKIREADRDCIIIFVTTSVDYRAEGFEVGAVHYLIKPATYEGVEMALNRCKRLFSEDERYFNIRVDRRIVRVSMKDVLYAEVYGKTVLVHTISNTLKTHTPLTEIADLLEGGPFLNCHRCYIVNMRFISEVLEEDFLLENGQKVPIRKSGRQRTKDEYISYFFNSIRR